MTEIPPCPVDEHGIPRDGHATVAYERAAQGINRISVGASVRLWSEGAVAEALGVDLRAAQALLDALLVPRLNLPGAPHKYVNLYALESCLFAMSLPTTMRETPDGAIDQELIRLHQELAGAVYMTATKEAIRERVKKLALQMGRSLGKKGRPKRKV
jgi:hypothetical protein